MNKRMKIGFLFNHEQLHQIPHAISVAYELSVLSDSVEVSIITSSQRQLDYVKTFESLYPEHKCQYISIALPDYIQFPGSLIDKALPFTKIMMMRYNLDVFRTLDALVAPEKTCLLLKTRFGLDSLRFIFTSHGAGDRTIGYNSELGNFDLIFLSGPKVRDRMQESGILDTAVGCMVGYPKFDAVGAYSGARKRIFDNSRPTVLYNPHFTPHLSSWYKMGPAILEYFYNSREYNLIFAPHTMLYTRKIHFSQEKLSAGWVKNIPARYLECGHMHIDKGSNASSDMTYTLAADLYMGDVSSQFYEFLINPRPCLFLNAFGLDWKDSSSFLFWHCGPVIEEVRQLDGALRNAMDTHPDYRGFQQGLFESTFDITETPSSERAAKAIWDYMVGVNMESVVAG